ncbi:MAG: sodium:panthothenate symporter, partial [Lentisphaeria bacterium]|nr:sodium:panthothenate symporter [Lentisphaeria bacterium]
AITGAIWAGAGSVITFGLYWKRGTTQGAFTSLILGALIATTGIIAQKTWASHIYPAIERAGQVEAWEAVLQTMAKPFGTYVSWHMNPFKFPFTSVEVSIVATVCTVSLYIIVSLLTCKEPFNMDRLLHRGIYSDKGEVEVKPPFQLGVFLREKILGITSEYTRGDKILAWSVFIYSFGYNFGLCFIMVIIWNVFQSWTMEAWSMFFFIRQLLVAGIIGLITAFWFGICGTRDLLQLFRDLETKEVNELDNGSVVGHVSAMDLAKSREAEARAQAKEQE